MSASVPPLDDARLSRYARQLLVPGFGDAAQRRLEQACVRAVGANAVASAALVYLVLAGIGRVWIDDPEPSTPRDEGGWLHPPPATGRPRAEVAREALSALSRFTRVEAYPAGGVPTAALVAASTLSQALQAAESARRAGIPHVVLEPDADGGILVSVPPGGPCYTCGRSGAGEGRSPLAGAAALAALAAQELVQMIASPGTLGARRLELVRGVAMLKPISSLPGCVCGRGGANASR